MNAKELLERFDFAGFNPRAQETILRALRLLAAAEGWEVISTPVTDDHLIQGMFVDADLSRRFERERNGLAARVAELEPDAERYRWMRDQPTANIYACWFPPVFPPVANDAEQRDRAIDAARSK